MASDSSPIKKLAGGLVQLSLASKFVGFGFLISDHQIITCAHVLKAAENPGPKGYKITFPFDKEAKSVRASLIQGGSFPDQFVDIAILEIHKPESRQLQPAPVIFIPPEALWHHRFMAYGFPPTSPVMDYVDGIIFGPNDWQWIQLEDKDNTGRFIEKGFSGTPIWDEDLQAIVGMLVALDPRYPRIAFMTPITTIAQAYPPITGAVYNNIKSSWRTSLEDHYGFRTSYVDSPLEPAWRLLAGSPSWHDHWLKTIKRLRSAARVFVGLREVEQKAAVILNKISTQAIYEVIYAEIKELSALLSSPYVDKKINQQIAKIEEITGSTWGDLRNARPGSLSPDEERQLMMYSLRQYQADLREASLSPEFDKCLLVMGAMGSGKTHFIHEILQASLEADDLVVLPLARGSQPGTLAEMLLESLNAASGMHWPGLEYFDSFLKAYDRYMDGLNQEPQILKVPSYDFGEEDQNILGSQADTGADHDEQTQEEPDLEPDEAGASNLETLPHDTRWVVAIDDLSFWAVEKRSFVTEWIDLVVKSTNLHSLCWVATMPNSFYPQLAQFASPHQNFWAWYGVITYQDDIESSMRGYKTPIPNVGRWLALDALNVKNEVGLNLVREGLEENWEQVDLAIQHNEAARNNLSNPLIAWTWLDMVTQPEFSNLVTAVNLNFIEFIQYFWKQQFSSLLSHPLNQRYALPFSEKELRYFVILLARHITQNQGRALEARGLDASRLVSSISLLSNGKMGFDDRNRVAAALGLVKLGLILGEKVEEDSLQEPEENLELRFSPFWGYFLAQEIMDRGKTPPTAPAQMELLFKNIQAEFVPDTLEYFLMLANNQLNGAASLPYFENALASTQLPASSVWMASSKSNEAIKTSMSARAQRAAGRVFDAQALFAYLYFLCELPIQVLGLRERFGVFHKLFSQIGRNNFSDYFLYITARLFEKIESPAGLLGVMPCLSNCEVMGISRPLAELSAEAIFRLVKKQAEDEQGYVSEYDPIKVLNLLLEYLASIKDEHYSKNDFESYRENVLYYVFYNLAFDQGPELYDLLLDVDWYENRQFDHNPQIQLHMERQANRALGMLYRSYYEEDLVGLLDELCESDDALNRVNAVHIIRHTEIIGEGKYGVHVSRNFRAMLEKLFLDESSRMTRLINHPVYNQFFRDNLEDYDALENQRNS